MKKADGTESHTPAIIVTLVVIAMAITQLFISFKGLNDPVAMDQAQIARQLIRGEGMTTKFLRPIAMTQTYSKAEKDAKKETGKLKKEAKASNQPTQDIYVAPNYNALQMPDTSNAPLNILADAAALKIVGADNFDAWKLQKGKSIYAPDMVIAGVSMIFFLLSIFFIFRLIKRAFDSDIASITCILISLSNLFLSFSTSGLPQMLMLFLFVLGLNSLYTAIENHQNNKPFVLSLCLAALFFSLLCLAGWVAIWLFLGFVLFVGIRFKPHGLYCIPAVLIFLALVSWSVWCNYKYSGNIFGTSVYSIYQGIIGREDLIMRAVAQRNVPINPTTILSKFLGSSFTQVTNLYTNMGGIIVTPFFFLALFHTFKNPVTNSIKWGVFIIWVFGSVGMSLYSSSEALTASQLQIMSTPLFTAFGLAFLLVLLSRAKARHANVKGLKPFILSVVILVSSGPLLIALPDSLKFGLISKSGGFGQWPPYFPLALNWKLHDMTKSDKVIASDQPWAVAWYADRPSMWLPRKKEAFFELEEILKNSASSVGGILITPSSHSTKGGLSEAIALYGDFASFVMEGLVFEVFPGYNAYISTTNTPTGKQDPIITRFAHPDSRVPLLGAQIMYYSEEPVTNR